MDIITMMTRAICGMTMMITITTTTTTLAMTGCQGT